MQLLRRDEAAVVLVEVLEGVVHDLLAVQLAQVDRGRDELLVVDQLVAVDVDQPDDLLNLNANRTIRTLRVIER